MHPRALNHDSDWVILNPLTLPGWFLPARVIIKAPATAPFSPSASTPPWRFPRGPPWHGRPSSLWLCEYNKPSFRRQLSPVLSALSHLSHNKTYALKHVPNWCGAFILAEYECTVPITTPHLPSFLPLRTWEFDKVVWELLGATGLGLEVKWRHRLFYSWIRLSMWDKEPCALLAHRAVTVAATNGVTQGSLHVCHKGMS